MKFFLTALLLSFSASILSAQSVPAQPPPAQAVADTAMKNNEPKWRVFAGYATRLGSTPYGLTLGYAARDGIGVYGSLKFSASGRRFQILSRFENEPINPFDDPEIGENVVTLSADIGIVTPVLPNAYGFIGIGYGSAARYVNFKGQLSATDFYSRADYEAGTVLITGGVIAFPVPLFYAQLGIDVPLAVGRFNGGITLGIGFYFSGE